MASAAVLDRETGLVWEKAPSTTGFQWFSALSRCVQLNLGGRKGWRLPTIQDLASLFDSTQANPALPSGHPFTVPVGSGYWSATTYVLNATSAWFVVTNDGIVDSFSDKSNGSLRAWCVRGGPGGDPCSDRVY